MNAPRCPACGRAGPLDAPCPCGRGAFVVGHRDPLVGRVVDGMALLAPLAVGGQARVYLARQGAEAIAVKVFDAAATARFDREARVLGLLRGPHLPRLLGHGAVDGRPYLAQALVDGAPLASVMRGRMNPARAIHLMDQVLAALEVAHAAGVVHRDLTPTNIRVGPAPDEDVTVLDFGLAAVTEPAADLTTTGAIVGSPHFMAPEQIDRRAAIGPATDLYAVGLILHTLLSGARPFDGFDPLMVLRSQLADPLPALPGSVPADLASVVQQAAEKDPLRRFRSARTMRRALATVEFDPDRVRWWRRPWRQRARP